MEISKKYRPPRWEDENNIQPTDLERDNVTIALGLGVIILSWHNITGAMTRVKPSVADRLWHFHITNMRGKWL
ncbi:hypothetical protein SLA2020_454280 [Shorea laevis]